MEHLLLYSNSNLSQNSASEWYDQGEPLKKKEKSIVLFIISYKQFSCCSAYDKYESIERRNYF